MLSRSSIRYILNLKNLIIIWALGLHGVVASLARRKTGRFDFDRVHHSGFIRYPREKSNEDPRMIIVERKRFYQKKILTAIMDK